MVDPCTAPDLPNSFEFSLRAATRMRKSLPADEDRPAAADVFWHGSPAMVFGSSSCCSSSGDSAKFLCWTLFGKSTFFVIIDFSSCWGFSLATDLFPNL